MLGQVVDGVTASPTCRSAWRWSWSWTRSTRTSTSTWCWSGSRSSRRGGGPVSTTGRHRSGSACTRGASGAATSSSTACTRPAPRSPTPGSTGATSSSWPAPTRCATATPATSPASTFAQALGWTGVRSRRRYAACASGALALDTARAQILAGDVRRRAGGRRRHHAQGLPRTERGRAADDPDWLRFRLLGATNPAYFALYARRRMDLYGATSDDFAQVKVKNARHGLDNPNARYRKEVTVDDVLGSPRSSPIRCACSTSAPRHDGAAAVVLDVAGLRDARPRGFVDGRCASSGLHRHADASRTPSSSMPNFATDSRRRPTARAHVQGVDRAAAYEEAGHRSRRRRRRRGLRPVDRARARLVRGPRALQARARPSSCCATATPRSAAGSRSTPPAVSRASARRCRRRRSPRCASSPGSCAARPAAVRSRARKVGITANQGLFGHGSSVILAR